MAFKMKMKGNYGKGMPMKSPIKDKKELTGEIFHDSKATKHNKAHDAGKDPHSPNKHATDAWGFKHGKKYHRPTLKDQSTPAPGHKAGEAVPKMKSPAKHATDAWGFKHGKKYHRPTLADQETPAPGHGKGEKIKQD